MSENLRVGLGGVYPNDRKVYSPIFASSSKSMNVSLSIQAEFEYTRNVGMTLIYWDNGEKKVYGESAIPYGTYNIIYNWSPKFYTLIQRGLALQIFQWRVIPS